MSVPSRAAASRCLLSNGSTTVMLHVSGSGFSHWRDQAVTRWREDPVAEPWGSYLLLRDEDGGAVWSATRQPFGTSTPDDAVVFTPGRASFRRRHHSVHTMLDVAVAGDLIVIGVESLTIIGEPMCDALGLVWLAKR